eukprot:6216611-Amphidinium_carterae.1
MRWQNAKVLPRDWPNLTQPRRALERRNQHTRALSAVFAFQTLRCVMPAPPPAQALCNGDILPASDPVHF